MFFLLCAYQNVLLLLIFVIDMAKTNHYLVSKDSSATMGTVFHIQSSVLEKNKIKMVWGGGGRSRSG